MWAPWGVCRDGSHQGLGETFLGCSSIRRHDPRLLCCKALPWLVQPGVLSLAGDRPWGSSRPWPFLPGGDDDERVEVSTSGHSCVWLCSACPHLPQPHLSSPNTKAGSCRTLCPSSLAPPPPAPQTLHHAHTPSALSSSHVLPWWRCATAQRKGQKLRFFLKRWILRNYGVPAELSPHPAPPAPLSEVRALLSSSPVSPPASPPDRQTENKVFKFGAHNPVRGAVVCDTHKVSLFSGQFHLLTEFAVISVL